MVEIKFFDLKMNKIELKNLISEYEKEGWDYTLKDKFNPGIVIDPKNNPWEVFDCLNNLEDKLEFGNLNQIGAYHALDFFNVLYNNYGDSYLGFDPKKCGMYQEDEEDFLFKPNL